MGYAMTDSRIVRRRRRRNGLAAFRAVEVDVQAALTAGRTLVAIYGENRERLGISYAQFARYVERIRRSDSASAPERSPRGRKSPPVVGTGPPRGRPIVRTLDVDCFAAQALKKKDLF